MKRWASRCSVVLFVALAAGSVAAGTHAPRYEVKFVAKSPTGLHKPFVDGTFWLGDDVWLYFRARGLERGTAQKYQVSWVYDSFPMNALRNHSKSGYVSRTWPKTPPHFKSRFNSNVTVTWWVNGGAVVRKHLRITGE